MDAQAQTKSKTGKAAAVKVAPKLYRWVDDKGQVHFTDSLPEEALQQGRTEYSRQGTEVRTVERALTPAELAEKQKQDALLRQEAEKAAQAQKDLAVLRMSYPTEASIRQNFVQRRSIYEGRIVALNAVLKEKNRELLQQLELASQAELQKKTPSQKMQNKIQDLARQRQAHRNEILETTAAMARLTTEEQALVEQWRQAQPTTTVP
jgi:hypothetical protein